MLIDHPLPEPCASTTSLVAVTPRPPRRDNTIISTRFPSASFFLLQVFACGTTESGLSDDSTGPFLGARTTTTLALSKWSCWSGFDLGVLVEVGPWAQGTVDRAWPRTTLACLLQISTA